MLKSSKYGQPEITAQDIELILAASNGSLSLIEEALTIGANIDVQLPASSNSFYRERSLTELVTQGLAGYTALHAIAANMTPGRDLAFENAMQYLLEEGAYVNTPVRGNIGASSNQTVLDILASRPELGKSLEEWRTLLRANSQGIEPLTFREFMENTRPTSDTPNWEDRLQGGGGPDADTGRIFLN